MAGLVYAFQRRLKDVTFEALVAEVKKYLTVRRIEGSKIVVASENDPDVEATLTLRLDPDVMVENTALSEKGWVAGEQKPKLARCDGRVELSWGDVDVAEITVSLIGFEDWLGGLVVYVNARDVQGEMSDAGARARLDSDAPLTRSDLAGTWRLRSPERQLEAYFSPGGVVVYSEQAKSGIGRILLTWELDGDSLVTDQPSKPGKASTPLMFAGETLVTTDLGERMEFERVDPKIDLNAAAFALACEGLLAGPGPHLLMQAEDGKQTLVRFMDAKDDPAASVKKAIGGAYAFAYVIKDKAIVCVKGAATAYAVRATRDPFKVEVLPAEKTWF